MRCPVCDNDHTSPVCPVCGFDSSMDYGKYPTFGSIGNVPAVSSLRQEWAQKQPKNADEPVSTMPPQKKKPRLLIAACAAILALGIGVGAGLSVKKPEPTEPKDTVQMQPPGQTSPSPQNGNTADPRQDLVLRSAAMPDGPEPYAECATASVFGSLYRREQIRSVTFLSTLKHMPQDAWDVSVTGNGKVMAWVTPNGKPHDQNWNLYDLYIGAEGIVHAGETCRDLFAGYVNLESITFGRAFRTDLVRDMHGMFLSCEHLSDLDLSSLNTSSVQDMSMMFADCNSLWELTLGENFDTSNVQNMESMFSGCIFLNNLDLSSFNTSNVRSMRNMFDGMIMGPTSLDLSSFDTSNVQDMCGMFASCWHLKELILGDHFDTSQVQDMASMFYWCGSLTGLDLGDRFDTSKVQDMSMMFAWSTSLTALTLGDHFDTSNVQNMGYMFDGCSSLTALTLGDHFDTSNVQNMGYMFNGCSSLTELTLGDHFDTSNADTTEMFYNCPAGENYRHLVH